MQDDSVLKISHIDDDPQIQAMMADFLKEKYPQAEITTYSTGEEALQGITLKRDLIVLDYNLDSVNVGGMDGMQVFRKLKERLPSTPVIFISAQKETEVAANAIMTGAKDYIVKNEKLFQSLDNTLNNIIGKPVQPRAEKKKRPAITLIIVAVLVLAGVIIWRSLN